MAKYKDSFQINTESLQDGGQGIVKAVQNTDPDEKKKVSRPPNFDRPKSNHKVSPIRTLADDANRAVEENKVTMASRALSAQNNPKNLPREKAPNRYSETKTVIKESEEKKSNLGTIAMVLVFLIFIGSLYVFASRQGLSIGSFPLPQLSFGSFFTGSEKSDPEVETKTFDALVKVDDEVQISTDQISDSRSFSEALLGVITDIEAGRALTILMTKPAPPENAEQGGSQEISPGELFRIFETSVDSALVRNIRDYTLGAINVDNKKELFLVAELSSFEESYAAIFFWEANIARDLYGVFHQNQAAAISQNNLSFRDVIVRGSDARELIVTRENPSTADDDAELETFSDNVLIYSFPQKNILIITQSQEVMAELIDRLEAKDR